MPKPPGMAEDFTSPEVDRDRDQAEHGAGKRSTRAVYIAIGIALVILFALVAIGLHIPTGG